MRRPSAAPDRNSVSLIQRGRSTISRQSQPAVPPPKLTTPSRKKATNIVASPTLLVRRVSIVGRVIIRSNGLSPGSTCLLQEERAPFAFRVGNDYSLPRAE